MEVAVRYYSKGGNTAQIAQDIARAAGVEAQPITVPLEGPVDILFLGGAPYAFHLAKPLRDFIASGLNPAAVKAVAVFSTSGSPLGASKMIAKACRSAGLQVLPQEFHCQGPAVKTEEAKKQAQRFAQAVLEHQRSSE